MAPEDAVSPALQALVHELLLERSAHYTKTQLVAYLDGWSGALELLQKTQLTLPHASQELQSAVSASVEQVRKAQYRALDHAPASQPHNADDDS